MIAAGAPAAAFASDTLGGYRPALQLPGVIDAAAALLVAVNWWQVAPRASLGRRSSLHRF